MQRHGLQAYWQAGNLSGAITVAIMYLESVNLDDSAGVSLGYCREVALDDDNNVIHTESGNYLFKDNEFSRAEKEYSVRRQVSSRGLHVDKETHEYLVRDMTYRCSCCNTYKNIWNMTTADDDERICNSCISNIKKCDCCGTPIYNSDNIVDVNGGMHICKKCADTKSYICSLCGCIELIDSDDILYATREKVKEHAILHKTIGLTDICPACIEILKEKKILRDRTIASFTKAKVSREVARVVDNIPLQTSLILSESGPLYIEKAIPTIISKTVTATHKVNVVFKNYNQIRDSSVAHQMGSSLLDSERAKVFYSIMDLYLPISRREYKDRIEYRVSSINDIDAEFIPKSIFLKEFKDFSISKETKEITYIEYNNEYYNDAEVFKTIAYIPYLKIQEMVLDSDNISEYILDKEKLGTINIQEKTICPVCKEEITSPYNTTKGSMPVHIECSSNVGVRCTRCGNTVALSSLVRNMPDVLAKVDREKWNWCKDCIENYEMIQCSRCDTHIYRVDANYINHEPYCEDCAVEIYEDDNDDF